MRFRLFFLTVLFVFIFSCSVFADDNDYSFSMAINNSSTGTSYNIILSMDNFVFSDSVDYDDLKIYAYARNSGSFIVVSNYSFTADVTVTIGSSSTVYTWNSGTSSCNCTYVKNSSVGKWTSAQSLGSLAGYNCLMVSGYYYSSDLDSCSILSTSNVDTSVYVTAEADGTDVYAAISDDFFQCPPTSTTTYQTMSLEVVGDYLLTYLTSGVGLAILLISLLIFLTMLSRFVHHWLNL